MLGIHGVGRDGADYYLSDLAQELPVAEPGCWVGTAARGLGLDGPLGPVGLSRLLGGRHPGTGQPMGSGRVGQAAFDLTFSAPKSASVLFALGGEAAARHVVGVHADAVAGALTYLERHAVTAVRRSGGERVVIPTTGMVAARFTHAVNRNGDPHLHSHVVMANLVHGGDGRWSACDRRGIEAHRQAASAVYATDLRAGLCAVLGVRWSRTPGRTAEIAGVGPHLLGEFSSRGADIRRHRYEVGARSGRGDRIAWAVTRPAKTPVLSRGDLVAEWDRRARAVGGPRQRLLEPGRPSRAARRPVLDEHHFAAVISLTPHGGARRRDVVAAFGAAALDGVSARSLERLVDAWVPGGPVGMAEPLRSRRSVVPANHLIGALGPRPLHPDEHELWMGAARAIEAYRERWGLGRSPEALGATSTPDLASMPATRLADLVRTARHLDDVRARLGRRGPVAVERGLGR